MKNKTEKIKIILMSVIAVILLPILAINLTLIIKGSMDRDTPPDIFGIAPLAVTSGSMEGDQPDSFQKGALIFVKLLEKEEIIKLKEGDIITFLSSDTYVTHRIKAVQRGASGEVLAFVTQGDANSVTDGAIPLENVVGQCVGSVEGLGEFSLFMQTPAGILLFVGVPVVLYILMDALRISLYNRRVKADKTRELSEKDAEIERLRALVSEKAGQEPNEPEPNEPAGPDGKEPPGEQGGNPEAQP